MLNQSFGVLWRKGLAAGLPRLVPDYALRYTNPKGPQPFVVKLPSRGSHKIPVYVFVPNSPPKRFCSEGFPVLLDFHGGSFVFGSCLEQAPFCAKFARELGFVVITVDYRLGPYDKFPAALEDAEDVLSILLDQSSLGHQSLVRSILGRVLQNREHITSGEAVRKVRLNTDKIALSGFSSGGNLALNLVLSIPPSPPYFSEPWPSRFPADRKQKIPVLLFYPSFDSRQLPSERTRPEGLGPPSTGILADLDDELMPTYLPRSLAEHPRASPGLVALNAVEGTTNAGLHEQSSVALILPQLDSLAEQSEIWIKRVTDEGKETVLTVKRIKGMKHGWTQFPDFALNEEEKLAKNEIFDFVIGYVRDLWDRQPAGGKNENKAAAASA